MIEHVIATVRDHLGRGIRVPSRAKWVATDRPDGGVRLDLVLDAAALARNFQETLPSSPSYLLALAYWFEQATSRPTTCRVTVEGEPPPSGNPLLHWRRSLFLLHEMEQLLGDRFVVDAPARWAWPGRPVINAPLTKRSSTRREHDHPEHALETFLCRSREATAAFSTAVAPVTRFRRQLPVGLFDGTVSKATAWTPGQGSQVDLWAESPDGRTVHLFELKAWAPGGRPNASVGIIPEALYYARLLHHVRTGLGDGRHIEGGGDGAEAVRRAQRLVMWLVAPDYHPLVFSRGETPLAWLNAGMAGAGVELRVLPVEMDREGGFVGWYPAAGWPATRR